MKRGRLRRLTIESGLGSLSAALGVLTLFWRGWLEDALGWHPDHGEGTVEWMIAAVFLLTALVLGARATASERAAQRGEPD